MSDFSSSPEFDSSLSSEASSRIDVVIHRGVGRMTGILYRRDLYSYYRENYQYIPSSVRDPLRNLNRNFRKFEIPDGMILHPEALHIEVGVCFGRFLAGVTLDGDRPLLAALDSEITVEFNARLKDDNPRFAYEDWIEQLGKYGASRLAGLFRRDVIDWPSGTEPYKTLQRSRVLQGAGYVFAKMERLLIEQQLRQQSASRTGNCETAAHFLLEQDLLAVCDMPEGVAITLADFGISADGSDTEA